VKSPGCNSDLRFCSKCATVLGDETSKNTVGGAAGRRGSFCIAQSLVGLARKSESLLPTSADPERDKIAGADAFDRGWLPVVLKSGVNEIREEHNVSTNHGRATFRYTPVFGDTLERSCSPLPPDAPVHSPFWRWPGFLSKGDTAAKLRSRNLRVFKCDDFTLAINDEQAGFFWH
jgi:hypothetical protein